MSKVHVCPPIQRGGSRKSESPKTMPVALKISFLQDRKIVQNGVGTGLSPNDHHASSNDNRIKERNFGEQQKEGCLSSPTSHGDSLR